MKNQALFSLFPLLLCVGLCKSVDCLTKTSSSLPNNDFATANSNQPSSSSILNIIHHVYSMDNINIIFNDWLNDLAVSYCVMLIYTLIILAMSLREHLSLTTEDIDEDVTASSITSLHSVSKITEAAHEDEQASESIKEEEDEEDEEDDVNVSMIEHVYEPTEDGLDLSFMETPRRKEFNLDSTPSDTTTPRSQLTDLDCSELSCVSSPNGEDFVQADEDLDISHNEEFIDIEIPFDEAISMNMSKIESLCHSQNPAMCGFLGEATQLLEQIKIMKDANAADEHEKECRIFGLEMELYKTRLQRMEMEANVITYKLKTL